MDCSFLSGLSLRNPISPIQNRPNIDGQLGENARRWHCKWHWQGPERYAIGRFTHPLGAERTTGIYGFNDQGMNFRYILHGKDLVVHKIGFTQMPVSLSKT